MKACTMCGKKAEEAPIKLCGGCKLVGYCGSEYSPTGPQAIAGSFGVRMPWAYALPGRLRALRTRRGCGRCQTGDWKRGHKKACKSISVLVHFHDMDQKGDSVGIIAMADEARKPELHPSEAPRAGSSTNINSSTSSSSSSSSPSLQLPVLRSTRRRRPCIAG